MIGCCWPEAPVGHAKKPPIEAAFSIVAAHQAAIDPERKYIGVMPGVVSRPVLGQGRAAATNTELPKTVDPKSLPLPPGADIC